MVFLVIGSVINLVLTFILVPKYSITGAAIATTIAAFIIMIFSTYTTLRITKAKLPYIQLFKIFVASMLTGFFLIFIPKNIFGLLLALFATPVIYLLILSFIKAIEHQDLIIITKVGSKMGPLSIYFYKFSRLLEIIIK